MESVRRNRILAMTGELEKELRVNQSPSQHFDFSLTRPRAEKPGTVGRTSDLQTPR